MLSFFLCFPVSRLAAEVNMAETNGGLHSPTSPRRHQQQKRKLPPRQYQPIINARPRTPQGLNGHPVPDTSHLAPPPQRLSQLDVQSEPSATDYKRDLRKLTAYLIPYPKPHLPGVAPEDIPQRFLVYTPPSPPFHTKPPEGRREGVTQWTKRHWYKELREAKMRDPPNGKATKWKRLKWKGTKATDWGIRKVKSSNLEFLNRVAGLQDEADRLAEDVYHRSVSPEEIRLIYPPAMNEFDDLDEEALKREFLASMQRTKRKAYKHSVYATLLMPPALVFDTVIVPVWPFGGAAEVDAVWLYASVRGAKTSRDVMRRLGSEEKKRKRGSRFLSSKNKKGKVGEKGDETAADGNGVPHQQDQTATSPPSTIEHEPGLYQQQDRPKTSSKKRKTPLNLTFIPSPRIGLLEQYLASACHKHNPDLFPIYNSPPSESQVLEAIGWLHSDQNPAYAFYRNPSRQNQNTQFNIIDDSGDGVESNTNTDNRPTSTGSRRTTSRGRERERERDAGGAGGLAHKAMSWDDEQWEILQVKDDLKDVFGKGAKEWGKWCLLWKKKPGKAEKR
ncbi:hypothetical protein CBER1_10634 [Cercospora berteroae]|uniref:Uncharacterized protein n=1 Tax=Cercospora berteroae TaxID=357750 RepID=A0A2S6CJD5_9PEZI|nr:hypothetical protein CBER1_10634 [Cercospora berteroae]